MWQIKKIAYKNLWYSTLSQRKAQWSATWLGDNSTTAVTCLIRVGLWNSRVTSGTLLLVTEVLSLVCGLGKVKVIWRISSRKWVWSNLILSRNFLDGLRKSTKPQLKYSVGRLLQMGSLQEKIRKIKWRYKSVKFFLFTFCACELTQPTGLQFDYSNQHANLQIFKYFF